MRIAIGGIAHETNTFATSPTVLNDFLLPGGQPALRDGAEILEDLRGMRIGIGAFIDAADELGLELAPLIWTFAQPGGTVAQDAWEFLSALLLERLEAALPVSGVLLDLHGAMVTEQAEDAEGELLARVRAMVGPHAPVVATLDLHANITPAMTRYANALVGYDSYPHVDAYERGVEAARIAVDAISGRTQPVCALAQVPMLIGPPKQCTLISPMRDIIALAHQAEARPGIMCVTVSGGFPFADIHDAGASVAVTADGDPALAQNTADEIAAALWQRREEFRLQLAPVRETIQRVLAEGVGPVILADGSDNPGGGAPCDGTVLLQALIEARAPRSTVAVIADPEAVAGAMAAGEGGRTTLTIGGKTDDRHGPPLTLTGTVRTITDGNYVNRGPMFTGMPVAMGRTAVFVVDDVEVVLTERRVQPYDMEALRSVGIEPTERLIIGLKSAVHFRADYGRIAHAIYDLATPGVHYPDVTAYEYRRLRRPMWPLDY